MFHNDNPLLVNGVGRRIYTRSSVGIDSNLLPVTGHLDERVIDSALCQANDTVSKDENE